MLPCPKRDFFDNPVFCQAQVMHKILIGLIVVGVVAIVVIRWFSRPTPESPAPTEAAEKPPAQTPAEKPKLGDARYQELMRRTGTAGRSEEGLRDFARRVELNRLTYRELEELFESLASDPETSMMLMERVLEEPAYRWQPLEKERLLRRAGVLAAATDFNGLMERLADLDSVSDRTFFAQGAAETLARQGIEKGLDWAKALDEEALRAPALYGVGKAWAQQEVDSAIQWAEGLEEPESRRQALSGLVAGWTLEEPEEAYEYAANVLEDLRDSLIVEAAGALSLSNPKQASQWAVASGGDPRQEAVLEESIFGWAMEDADEVEEWSDEIRRSDLYETAKISWAHHWSQNEPQQATEWAAKFPTKSGRARMLERTLARWAQTDPYEAARWFQNRTPNLEELTLLKETLKRIAGKDIDLAQAWVDEIAEAAFKIIGQQTIQSFPETLQ